MQGTRREWCCRTANVLATIAALQTYVREVGLDVTEADCTLSYLTLAHIFGRALEEFRPLPGCLRRLLVGESRCTAAWRLPQPTDPLAGFSRSRRKLP